MLEFPARPRLAAVIGVRYNGRPLQPISMARIGKIPEKIPINDLYYLKRICDDAKHISKRFWWELDAKKHPGPTDLRSLADHRSDRPSALRSPLPSAQGNAGPLPTQTDRPASLWPTRSDVA